MAMALAMVMALVMALVFVAALFAGCGGNNSGSNSGSGAASSGSASSASLRISFFELSLFSVSGILNHLNRLANSLYLIVTCLRIENYGSTVIRTGVLSENLNAMHRQSRFNRKDILLADSDKLRF